ncbi:MAG: pyridoxal 5'-phosphate synthase glutaminase subunit PdxT [Clostridiales bacterium]|nr:pyridoxal 5'-phosphate synthase glutaminase subunit PdxT [Clostridiales bacterium]MBD8948250.1 pyridoxal 5'-phosphate synthase glutaminase subunit PdxT [Clostridiales bacterium]
MKIGVIAVQGAFIEHEKMLAELGISSFEIRQNCDLNRSFDGFIIPGGESTVQGKLLKELNLFDALKELIKNGLPVFGTCAGLILLAKTIENERHAYFRTMDITARRNAYGRQLGSFHTTGNFKGIGDIPMTFIRAPYIQSAAKEVEILATVDGKFVAAKQKNQLVTAFHPELDHDLGVHRYFADMIKNQLSL